MPGMLRAARRKLSSIAAPSMISALVRPSFSKRVGQRLGLRLLGARLGEHDQLLALGLAGKRMLQRQRPHLLRQVVLVAADDRAEGLAAAAELRRRLVAVTGLTSALLLVGLLAGHADLAAGLGLVRAGLALESCQRTMRCRMSARGSRPKISSGSVIESADLPSSVVTLQIHHSASFDSVASTGTRQPARHRSSS